MAFYNANVNNIILSDINENGVKDVAERINGTAITSDVTNEKDVIRMVLLRWFVTINRCINKKN